MRFFTKLFLTALAAVALAVSLTEYLLISENLKNSLEREVENALIQYRESEAALRSGLAEVGGNGDWNNRTLAGVTAQISSQRANGEWILVLAGEHLVYTDFPQDYDYTFWLSQTETEKLCYRVENTAADGHQIMVCGCFRLNDRELCLLTSHPIERIFRETEQQEQLSRRLFFLLTAVSAAAVYLVTWFLTRPLQRLSQAAQHIAAGSYDKRVSERSRDEIGDLGRQFNCMAAAVEQKVEDLKQQAQQREDFVSSFAHEIKTPLTSMIGYADLLYQEKLDKEQQKAAHSYILNEGLRLEALSHKMMELTVLNQQEFLLEQMEIHDFSGQLMDSLTPWLEERKIVWHWQVEPAWLLLEPDLFQSLLLNLFENAAKAGTTDLWLEGSCVDSGCYRLTVRDAGCGIPPAELSCITEAFYMVDKSRARKQHGAGLGLALVDKIVRIHHGQLSFESEQGKGTRVRMELPLANLANDEDADTDADDSEIRT